VTDISDQHHTPMHQSARTTAAQRRAATAIILRRLGHADATEILAMLGLR
jgi:hypothetical protein